MCGLYFVSSLVSSSKHNYTYDGVDHHLDVVLQHDDVASLVVQREDGQGDEDASEAAQF